MSVLAIDAGTTGVTALVVTPDGRIAARGYQEFAQHFPQPGWVEHAPEEIWQATLQAVHEVLALHDAADLRVDDHPDPVTELARLLDLNDLYLTASTETERVAITPELDAEIEHLVHERGFPDLGSWVGTENYEMRVDPHGAWIDEKVLEILRASDDDAR